MGSQPVLQSSSVIRPFQEDDIGQTAELHRSVFATAPAMSPGLLDLYNAYFREVFLSHPRQHEDLPSLVYEEGGKVMGFTHLQVADVFPIELTVYKPRDLGTRPRSSTDGKPIVRVSSGALRRLCEKEHAELWKAYATTGAVPTMEEILSAEDDTGPEEAFEDTTDPWEDAVGVDPLEESELPRVDGSDDEGDDDADTYESREDDGFRGRRRMIQREDRFRFE